MRTIRNISLCFVVLFESVNLAPAANSLLDRVHNEFPAAMSRLETFYSQVRGATRWTQVESGKETMRGNITFAANRDWRKASVLWDNIADPKKRPARKIYVLGPKTAFNLLAGRDNSYVIMKVGPSDSQDAQLNLGKNFCNQALFAPCGIWGYPMSELMAEPGFQIISAEETISNQKKLVKIRYNCDHLYVKSGSIWADPSNCWAIQKVDCQVLMFAGSARHLLLCDIDYGLAQDEVPILHRILYTLKPPKDDPAIGRYEINEIVHEPTPEAEFTLPYYGLPEPPEFAKKPTPWYLWTALVGIICLGLAALFRWLARRKRYTVAPPSSPN